MVRVNSWLVFFSFVQGLSSSYVLQVVSSFYLVYFLRYKLYLNHILTTVDEIWADVPKLKCLHIPYYYNLRAVAQLWSYLK